MLENTRGNDFRVGNGGSDHLIQIFRRAAENFFTDDMLPGIDRIADDLGVTGVIGTDAYAVKFFIGKHFFIVCKALCSRAFFG